MRKNLKNDLQDSASKAMKIKEYKTEQQGMGGIDVRYCRVVEVEADNVPPDCELVSDDTPVSDWAMVEVNT